MEDVTNLKTSAYLTQIYGETTNRKYKIRGSKVTIGRSYHTDIKLNNPNISRHHCRLTKSKNGWTITDLKSQNGTYISGVKLKPDENRLLQCGDIIFLGPPSEMPEAFCFDDSFVDDEDIISESGFEIIEIPSIKRRAEQKNLTSKKQNIQKESADAEIKVTAPFVNNESSTEDVKSPAKEDYCNFFKYPNSLLNSNLSSKYPVSPKQNGSSSNCGTLHDGLKTKVSSFEKPVPTQQSKLNDSDSGYQIHEISSTGGGQGDDSLSLLENDPASPCCSSSVEVRQGPSSETSKETDLLKCKLELLSEKIKNLEKSKSDLLKNYEVVCEKNFQLDQELAEKKKLEGNLKSYELKAKTEIKNELLEKFEEDLMCNICTELLIKPTVLDCSHTFCQFCIKEWKKKKNECPICRRKIQTMTSVLTLEHFIDKALSTLTPEQKEKRSQLIKERENPPPKVSTPTTSKRRRSRFRQRGMRRPMITVRPLIHTTASRENDVQIVSERRNNILSVPRTQVLPPVLPLHLDSNMYLRIPEVLLDSDGDSFNVYIG